MPRVQSAVKPLFVLTLFCHPVFAQSTPTPISNAGDAAVVVITGTDGGGDTRIGSGFIVEPSGMVVTTYRTLRGLAKATVRLANGDVHDVAHVRAVDAAKNIAIIQLRAFGLRAVELGDSERVVDGSKLVVQASAVSSPSSTASAVVTTVERLPEGFRIFSLSPEPTPLHIGAALLTEDGKVAAIMAARPTTATGVPIGIPINYVRAMLSLDEKLSLEALSGLTASPPAAPLPPTATAIPNAAPAGDMRTGTVVFYRIRRFVGSALEPSVYCNDQELANMDNGRYFKAALAAGSYVCRSTDSTVVSFDLTPGQTRYMRVEILTGFMKGHGVLHEVPSKQGEVEVQKLKPADADHIKAAVLADR